MTGTDPLKPADIIELKQGMVGFGPIGGATGLLVALGQLMLGDEARFRHCFIVTRAQQQNVPPSAVEAMPGGARRVNIPERWTPQYVYIMPPYETGADASMVSQIACHMIGTPYSFADYLALALRRWQIPAPHLREYISTSKHMICSQFVDHCISCTGIKVFDDGRLSQDVTPGALFYRLLQLTRAPVLWPARSADDVSRSYDPRHTS